MLSAVRSERDGLESRPQVSRLRDEDGRRGELEDADGDAFDIITYTP